MTTAPTSEPQAPVLRETDVVVQPAGIADRNPVMVARAAVLIPAYSSPTRL